MKGLKYLAFLSLLGLIMLVGLNNNGEKIAKALASNTQTKIERAKVEPELLPTVGSFENLKRILEEVRPVGKMKMRMANGADAIMQNTAVPEAELDSGSDFGSNAADYSQTNVQVQGVDEADTVKTDGEYIYKITNNKVIVAKAYPAETMHVVSTLSYDQEMYPVEMYVDTKHLMVILNKRYSHWREVYSADADRDVSKQKIKSLLPPFEDSVKVVVYDLRDRTNLEQIREIEIDGVYISSRKIDNHLYLVNNKYLRMELLRDLPEELFTPAYRDSTDGGELKRIGYNEICYFPGSSEANYLIVAGINLDNPADQKTEVKTYLGSGQSIYSSPENLFVAVPEYKYEQVQPLPEPEANIPDRSLGSPAILPIPVEENTNIYKFSLQDGELQYLRKGSVPGKILNQFSMDEHQGYFRIATTEQEYSANVGQMTNNLFILDQEMKVAGKIENIAPGEKIYSARFLGDRGYMVTFKTVDPLFVLDLKEPQNPRILGELKIPGYSNYLHPYDEDHIIGFGKEALEVEEPHWSGQGTTNNAYYLGMKIALFDVSDVLNPKEKFKIEIGDRGTDSELFGNHKALLFSKEKNLLAFPVTVCERDPATMNKNDYLVKKDPRLAYGRPVFQGALVYKLSIDKGFEFKGTITHHPSGKIIDLQRKNQYDYNREVSRILYIGDILYTVSNGYLKANQLITLAEKGGIQL
jgi:inhibitor of cysteine peptidase